MMRNEKTFRLVIERRLGANRYRAYVDDVWVQVMSKMHTHLLKGQPVDHVIKYTRTVCRNESFAYLKALARHAERIVDVGDSSHILENEHPIHLDPGVMVGLEQAMSVLREELSQAQLIAFVLTEAYQLTSLAIAELLDTKPATVRDALRRARQKLKTGKVRHRLGIDTQLVRE
jgi:RNA polymerase sigma-70 factor (ECF subfamily)